VKRHAPGLRIADRVSLPAKRPAVELRISVRQNIEPRDGARISAVEESSLVKTHVEIAGVDQAVEGIEVCFVGLVRGGATATKVKGTFPENPSADRTGNKPRIPAILRNYTRVPQDPKKWFTQI